jgi:hypothetical protein
LEEIKEEKKMNTKEQKRYKPEKKIEHKSLATQPL